VLLFIVAPAPGVRPGAAYVIPNERALITRRPEESRKLFAPLPRTTLTNVGHQSGSARTSGCRGARVRKLRGQVLPGPAEGGAVSALLWPRLPVVRALPAARRGPRQALLRALRQLRTWRERNLVPLSARALPRGCASFHRLVHRIIILMNGVDDARVFCNDLRPHLHVPSALPE